MAPRVLGYASKAEEVRRLDLLRDLWRTELPLSAIGQRLGGLSPSSVSRLARRAHLTPRRTREPDPAKLAAVRDLYPTAIPIEAISVRLDVSAETVRRLARRAGLALRRPCPWKALDNGKVTPATHMPMTN